MITNPVPRVAAIHDISGYGRSSLTIVLPVLSALGVQACPLPTALLSTQTSGFTDYYYKDLSDDMEQIINHWNTLDIDFQGIYSGFLGSPRQIGIVSDFIDTFSRGNALVVVDPVMGDDGKTYGPIEEDLVLGMRRLIGKADIITPNYTEAALLLDRPYSTEISVSEIKEWLRDLTDMGPRRVIITSVPISAAERCSAVFAYDRKYERYWKVSCEYIPASYPGTGDMFASVIVGSLLKGDSLPIAMDRAVQFAALSIRASFGYEVPHREGVLLERVLPNLYSPITMSTYELVD